MWFFTPKTRHLMRENTVAQQVQQTSLRNFDHLKNEF